MPVLTGDAVKYLVEIFDGRGEDVCFFSSSRNARKHLRDRLPPSSAAKCIVYSANGEKVISACGYDEKGVLQHIVW